LNGLGTSSSELFHGVKPLPLLELERSLEFFGTSRTLWHLRLFSSHACQAERFLPP
jgi:hypothetical protein